MADHDERNNIGRNTSLTIATGPDRTYNESHNLHKSVVDDNDVDDDGDDKDDNEEHIRHQDETIYSGHTRSNEKVDSKLECFICRRLYHEPRILTCLHTFCSACILNLQTYPCNGTDVGSSTSSHDHSLPSDSLHSEGSDGRHQAFLEAESSKETSRQRRRDRSSSRKRGLSEERRGVYPMGKSQRARFIEDRITRSSSCGDRVHDTTLSVWPEAQVSRKSLDVSLRRSTSFADDRSRKTLRKSVVSSISFGSNYNEDVSLHRRTSEIFPKKNKRIILCPQCLREVEISKTLEELPRNFMLERLVAKEILTQTRSKAQCDSCIQQKVKTCKKKESNVDFNVVIDSSDVIAYCVDCQTSLCTTCTSKHRESTLKQGHQLIVLEQTNLNDGKNRINSSSSSGDYYSFSDSMTTIPESVKEEAEPVKIPPESKRVSKVPTLIGSVKKLKLPNLQKFSKLFNWKSPSRQTSQNLPGKENKGKVIQKKTSLNSVQRNGLVNNAFEDRRFTTPFNGFSQGTIEKLPMETIEHCLNGQHSNTGPIDIPHNLIKEGKDANDCQLRVDPHHVIPCWKHPKEALKMFCVTCELCVCRECVVMQHKEHEWELLTRHLFQRQMEEVDQLIQQVLPRVQDVDNQLTFLDEVKDTLFDRSIEVSQRINSFMDSYVDAIQKHRGHLLEQVMSLVSAQECKINVTRTHLQDMRSDVEQTCCFVAELLTGSSDLEILSMKKLITQRLHGFNGNGSRNSLPTDSFIRFCPLAEGQVINNFQMFGKVMNNAPCASTSVLLTKGLAEAKAFQKCVVTLNVCDSEGNIYAGNDVKIRAWIIANGKGSVPVNIQDSHGDGVYSMTFTPNSRGTHFLHVTVNGSSVVTNYMSSTLICQNSPFKFGVKQKRQRHQGSWQCCTVCQTGGRRDVICGCGFFNVEGGYLGCDHMTSGHPGAFHWSCCGHTVKHSHCKGGCLGQPNTSRRQVTL